MINEISAKLQQLTLEKEAYYIQIPSKDAGKRTLPPIHAIVSERYSFEIV